MKYLKWALITFLVCSLLALPLFPHVANAQSTQFVPGSAQVSVTTIVSPSFSADNFHEIETVNASIDFFSLNLSSAIQISIISSFKASGLQAQVVLEDGTVETLQTTVISGTYGAFLGYYATLPSGTSNASIIMAGSVSAKSFLFRYVGQVPIVVLAGINVPTSYVQTLITPRHVDLAQAYYHQSFFLPSIQQKIPYVVEGQFRVYELPSNAAEIVLQSDQYYPASVAVSVTSLVLLIGLVFGVAESGRRILRDLSRMVGLPRITRIFKQMARILPRSFRSFSSGIFLDPRKRLTSKTFLALFVLTCILMISIGVLAGPAPERTAYIVADPSAVSSIQSSLTQAVGNIQVVTPSQDYSDFQVMSSVGFFSIVVFSNYPSLTLSSVAGFVVPNLDNVQVIIVDNTANATYASEIKDLYGSNVFFVNNTANMTQSEISTISEYVHCCAPQRANPLGITPSQSGFRVVVALEAALSMIIMLFGCAYLGSKASEPDNERTLFRICTFILSGVFVFFFAETTYVVTSSLLNFPLSLHAVISGAESITGIGVLGKIIHLPFGGGTTPRLASSLLGFLIGGLYTGLRTRYSARAIFLFTLLLVFLLTNPFQIGTITFQGFLYFFANTPLGTFFSSSYTLKYFVYGIGGNIAGDVSPAFLLSAGKMLYFAGLVPLAFMNKLRRNTASIALLVIGVMLAEGGVRVGEMTPTKTVIAVMPGIVTGFAFAFIFLLIGVIEKYLSRSGVR